MAIQYSGGPIINRTGALTTRDGWCNFISQALSDAGWFTISGTPGTIAPGGTVVMESAVANQGQKIRVAVFEPGSGTCAQAFIRHSSGSPTSQAFFASPAATWRVVANKFHFFSFIAGSATRLTARANVCGGVLYTPPFLTLTGGDANGWMQGNAILDTDATSRSSWRTSLRSYDASNTGGRFSGIYVNALMDANGYTNTAGSPYIACWQGGTHTGDNGYRWEDQTLSMFEPIVGWGTGANLAAEGRHKGQLYDAIVINGSWTSETQITFDGHTWLAYTDTPSSSVSCDASLFLLVA